MASEPSMFNGVTWFFDTITNFPEKEYDKGKYTAILSCIPQSLKLSCVIKPISWMLASGLVKTKTGLLNFFLFPVKAFIKSLIGEYTCLMNGACSNLFSKYKNIFLNMKEEANIPKMVINTIKKTKEIKVSKMELPVKPTKEKRF